jgi:hypothetical protein
MMVQRDYSRAAEIANGDSPNRGRRQGDTKAAVPQDPRPRGQQNRPGRAGKLTQNKNSVTPMDEAATGKRVSSARGSGEQAAQMGYLFASDRIRCTTDGSDNRLESPLGNVRWRASEIGIKNGEPGWMQNHCLSE